MKSKIRPTKEIQNPKIKIQTKRENPNEENNCGFGVHCQQKNPEAEVRPIVKKPKIKSPIDQKEIQNPKIEIQVEGKSKIQSSKSKQNGKIQMRENGRSWVSCLRTMFELLTSGFGLTHS